MKLLCYSGAIKLSKCQSVCHAVDVILPQVCQEAMKQTLYTVCLASRCGLPINGFRKLS